MMQDSLKVCYVLSYYFPGYVRTHTLLEALRSIDNINVFLAVNTSSCFLRYFQTIIKLLKVRLRHNPDCYIIGFRGHEIFWPVRLLTLGKRLIFDSMMSPSDALRYEKKAGEKGRLVSGIVHRIEKMILKSSDMVITDTELHRELFINDFGVAPEKIRAIPVGAYEKRDDAVASPYNNSGLNVLFYGSFLPLHGMDVILDAAQVLIGQPVHFTLIGGKGRTLDLLMNGIKERRLDNITHVKWVEQHLLFSQYIANADVCLGGPFGATRQAKRVITGKTFQSLCMARTTVVGKIDEDAGFADRENCLLIEQGDSNQLAKTLQWASDHRDKLDDIGQRGQELYNSRFSVSKISEKLKGVLL